MRDKLIELLNSFLGGCEIKDITPPYGVENLADYLIANGVTFAEPVKHGVWEMTEDDYMGLWLMRCSLCNEEWCFEGKEEGIDMQLANYNYCPNCGAKMERIKDNDTC